MLAGGRLVVPASVEVGAEVYWPIHASRQIRTSAIDAYVEREVVELLHVTLGLGLTAMHPYGEITQLGDHFEPLRFTTSVIGAGPVVLVRCEPLAFGPVRLGVDGLGALLLYSEHFPPGGDIYNFAWRGGPSMRIFLSHRIALTASVRWMHVSNGQGLGPQNPSYEAVGASLALTAEF
jgi:hypothetical protein